MDGTSRVPPRVFSRGRSAVGRQERLPAPWPNPPAAPDILVLMENGNAAAAYGVGGRRHWCYASRDRIEQQIIRAYVQLALTDDADCSRTVTLARLSGLEVRLTEAPWIEQLTCRRSGWRSIRSRPAQPSTASAALNSTKTNWRPRSTSSARPRTVTRPETEGIHGALSGLDDGAVEPLGRMRQGRET